MVKKVPVNCNICGSAKYTILYKDDIGDATPELDYNFNTNTNKTYQIVKCVSCGLVYVNPMPNLCNLYETVNDKVYLKSKRQRLRTAEKCVQKILEFKKGGDLIDIGCSTGDFLDVASKHFSVQGIELSEWAYKEAAKRHKVYNMPLSGLNLHEQFDTVTLFGVIEHFTNPSKKLDIIYNLLRPGGLVVIYTMDIDSWLPRLMGKKYWWFMAMHLFYFSRATCTSLLKKRGFRILKVEKHTVYYQIFSIGLSLQRYKIGKIVKPFSNLPFIRDIMVPFKLSGDMLVFCVKKHKSEVMN